MRQMVADMLFFIVFMLLIGIAYNIGHINGKKDALRFLTVPVEGSYCER